jgi:hypothetical protein
MYPALSDRHRRYTAAQKMFSVSTGSRSNVSPKVPDAQRVINPVRAIRLSVTGSGSGNETSTHVQADARMAMMRRASMARPTPIPDRKG